jgi:hypothetical protein
VDIAGKTSNRYVPTSDDLGHTLRLRVTASNSVGTSTPAISAQTGSVAPSTP